MSTTTAKVTDCHLYVVTQSDTQEIQRTTWPRLTCGGRSGGDGGGGQGVDRARHPGCGSLSGGALQDGAGITEVAAGVLRVEPHRARQAQGFRHVVVAAKLAQR